MRASFIRGIAGLAMLVSALFPMVVPASVYARGGSATVTVDHPPTDGVRAFDHGSRAHPQVALTFDADMTVDMQRRLNAGQVAGWYNREVIEVLRREQVPATLFLTGLWVQTYPGDARSLAADPLFEIGSHTYDHLAFRTPCYGLPPAVDRQAEITGSLRVIEEVTGRRPRLIRFPGDCYSAEDVAAAAAAGLAVISGDIRAGDGFNPSAAQVAATVLGRLAPGSIVIMHMHGGPNAPMTAPALRTIIPAARARGFEFVTASRLLGLDRGPAHRVGGAPAGAASDQVAPGVGPTTSDQVAPWIGPTTSEQVAASLLLAPEAMPAAAPAADPVPVAPHHVYWRHRADGAWRWPPELA